MLRKSAEGSQLVEFAILMPVLLILAVGIADLSAIAILRDKLTNAAREGARNAISQSTADLTQPDPPTVQTVRDAVVSYMNNASVSATLSGGACAAGPNSFSWNYCLTNGGAITIEREYTVTVGTTAVLCTRITVSYPYAWIFSYTAQLLGLNNPLTLSSQVVMRNLT
jgi:Flp pilus assembly protein TadG